MKKIIVIVLVALVFPAVTLAFFQPATLTNGIKRIAVFSESAAKDLFSKGFWLEGATKKAETCPAEKACPEVGAVTSNVFNTNYVEFNKNGVYTITGNFIDASTTIVSFLNPWGRTATATVDLVRLQQTGLATSTYTISCGSSAGPATAASLALLSSGSVSTSTYAYLIENNLSNALGASHDGGSVAKVALNGTYPYFVCAVTSTGTGATGAFTETTNTFAGNFVVRISRNRY